MLSILLIRHGQTYSNTLKRYLGTTDEGLLTSSIGELQNKVYPTADIIYTSPMLRCTQTAKILYSDKIAIIIDDFKECDFGDFENKNYTELQTNNEYQNWLQTHILVQFPNGENVESYAQRTTQAFNAVVENHKNDDITIALVVHGGTIMTIMHYLDKKNDIYDWHVKNGCGYEFVLYNKKIQGLKYI